MASDSRRRRPNCPVSAIDELGRGDNFYFVDFSTQFFYLLLFNLIK
jgi:hypothetical protein